MAFSKFLDFPVEVQDQIIEMCSPQDKLAFAQTSKSVNHQAILYLYRHVDISFHHTPGLFLSRSMKLVPSDNANIEVCPMQQTCEQTQRMFFDALKIHPEYANLVIDLTWTYFSEYDDWEEAISQQPMWDCLSLLKSVKRLDFYSLACQREKISPPPLFPNAEHICLGGQMTFAFAQSILGAIDPARLVYLELNNLSDFGQLFQPIKRDPYDENDDEPRHVQDSGLNLSVIPERDDVDGNPIIRHPGCMRGHLRRLEGLCPRLKHLSLRSVGQDDIFNPLWSPEIDAARYQEWASFINSVQHTLETLIIEQGLDAEDIESMPSCRVPAPQFGRPMDARFMQHIVPTLLNGSWPCLKLMKISGTGGRASPNVRQFNTTNPDIADCIYEQLRTKLGADIKLLVTREATKSYFSTPYCGNRYRS